MSTVTTIARDNLTARIDSMGAQLTSLALDGCEYLWQADPVFWGKHAPVLFPIVGSLRGDRAESAAGPCAMARHGLARIYEHGLVGVSEDGASATFSFESTEETLRAYPYRFRLNMTYALTGPASMTQTFAVTNTGDADMPFSVGGHPAFNIPVPGADGEAFEDYEFRFAEPWTCPSPKIVEGGLATYEDTFPTVEDSDTLPLTRDLFAYDTVIWDHVPGNTLSLVSRVSGRGVRMDFPGFDFIGIWSAPGAPFVALEPWTGHATLTTEDDVLEHKEGITILAPGATDTRSFTVTLL